MHPVRWNLGYHTNVAEILLLRRDPLWYAGIYWRQIHLCKTCMFLNIQKKFTGFIFALVVEGWCSVTSSYNMWRHQPAKHLIMDTGPYFVFFIRWPLYLTLLRKSACKVVVGTFWSIEILSAIFLMRSCPVPLILWRTTGHIHQICRCLRWWTMYCR